MRLQSLAGDAARPGLPPAAIARLYGLPEDLDGAGQTVGIVAGGGGWLPDDLAKATGRKIDVVEVSTDGTTNLFGGGTTFDIELALDLQVLAAIVPAARIIVYFCDDTQKGMAKAIEAAVADDVNRPSVLSVSWGSAEKYWKPGTDAAPSPRDRIQAALATARERKMTVVAAAGDQLATAGETRTANVLFPSSSPLVLACGGTNLRLSDDGGAIVSETVWKDGLIGTGGGISDVFDVPDYQAKIALPPSFRDGARRRGVPDVAAAASASPGYRVVVDGQGLSKDGTSAATPLWAGIVALANAMRGQPLGLINPYLYANPSFCRRIISGNNKVDDIGYEAGPDWNACCGLGAPVGAEIVRSLAMTV
jgi:kumamolisin